MNKSTNTKKNERNSGRNCLKAWKKNPDKNKSTGKTILGYKRERVVQMAKDANMSFDEYVKTMKANRTRKLEVMKLNRLDFAHLIRGVEMLYRNGTLTHRPMRLFTKSNR